MNAAVLELNDHEVRLVKDGQIVVRSPATAIVKGSNVEVGESANQQARLHPRESYNR
ncbi:MAG: ribosomal protein L27, partial [Gammaproteobacteria bacterium]